MMIEGRKKKKPSLGEEVIAGIGQYKMNGFEPFVAMVLGAGEEGMSRVTW